MRTLNSKEAANFLKMDEYTLEELARNGGIPGAKVSRHWVFIDELLEEYLIDLTKKQTDERRDLLHSGKPPKVKTAVTSYSRRKRQLPVLPDIDTSPQEG